MGSHMAVLFCLGGGSFIYCHIRTLGLITCPKYARFFYFKQLRSVCTCISTVREIFPVFFFLGYALAGKKFFEMSKSAFDSSGDVYPIWGTCLGFEMLAYLGNDDQPNLFACEAYNATNQLIPSEQTAVLLFRTLHFCWY